MYRDERLSIKGESSVFDDQIANNILMGVMDAYNAS